MAPEISLNTMQITPWATHGQVASARSQTYMTLAANVCVCVCVCKGGGGHMGLKTQPQIDVLGTRSASELLHFSLVLF